jgi:hypothetical protein
MAQLKTPLLMLCLCCLLSVALAQPTLPPQTIRHWYETYAHSNQPSARMAWVLKQLIKRPYQLGPLGEGNKLYGSPRPLVRTDAFDCMTLLNTTLAFAFAKKLNDYMPTLLDLRYHQSIIHFLTRRHFVSIDWNPHLTKTYPLIDITLTQTTPTLPHQTLRCTLHRNQWLQKRAPIYYQFAKANHSLFPNNNAIALSYIPKNKLTLKQTLRTLAQRMPHGGLFEVVRKQWPNPKLTGTYIAVSHVGAIVIRNHTLWVIHASSLKHTIIAQPLTDLIRQIQPSPTIIGLHILAFTR